MKTKSIEVMQNAVEELTRIAADFREVGHAEKCWDLIHYADTLDEMVSCDNGEAGMMELIRILERPKAFDMVGYLSGGVK